MVGTIEPYTAFQIMMQIVFNCHEDYISFSF